MGEGIDPLDALRAIDVVRAIARGFSHDKAMRLFDDDDMYLESINIKEAVGDRQSQVQRARGRIIGREGKTRRIIEDLADVPSSWGWPATPPPTPSPFRTWWTPCRWTPPSASRSCWHPPSPSRV